jgi:hypothetical protein
VLRLEGNPFSSAIATGMTLDAFSIALDPNALSFPAAITTKTPLAAARASIREKTEK